MSVVSTSAQDERSWSSGYKGFDLSLRRTCLERRRSRGGLGWRDGAPQPPLPRRWKRGLASSRQSANHYLICSEKLPRLLRCHLAHRRRLRIWRHAAGKLRTRKRGVQIPWRRGESAPTGGRELRPEGEWDTWLTRRSKGWWAGARNCPPTKSIGEWRRKRGESEKSFWAPAIGGTFDEGVLYWNGASPEECPTRLFRCWMRMKDDCGMTANSPRPIALSILKNKYKACTKVKSIAFILTRLVYIMNHFRSIQTNLQKKKKI